MFSQTTEYALRVVVFMAALKGTPATTRQISAGTRVPEGYLAKILQALARARLIKSQRGLHGGSVLTRDPAELSVLDVIEAISPLPRIRTCPLELASHGNKLCPLHKRLDSALEMVEQTLRSAKLAELMGEATASIPLGQLPGNPAAAIRAAEIAFPVSRTTPLTVSAKSRDGKRR